MSLEELLNTPTSVVSKQSGDRFNSAAIVWMITAPEIQALGATDLIQVLSLVPGFDFGTDTQGTLGLGARGNWAHEGKFLLMLDGIPLNENIYGTVVFGNRFPVDQIAKIEVIRGPGSVIYGGTAEFAVVNITTKSSKDAQGLELSGSYSQNATTFAQRNFGLAYRKQFGKTDVSIGTLIGQGQRTNRDYTDSTDAVYNMKDNAFQNPIYLNLGITHGDFYFRAILENQQTTDRSAYGTNLSRAVGLDFVSYSGLVGYTLNLDGDLKLNAELSYTNHTPWRSTDPVGAEQTGVQFDRTAQRAKAMALLHHSINPKLSAIYGLEFYEDFARDARGNFTTGSNSVSYSNLSLYSEWKWQPTFFDLHAGARFDYHNQFKQSFVPRIGLVRRSGSWNFKGLYSRAFHAPTIQNIDLNSSIIPEKTAVAEVEVSKKVSDNLFLSLNLYSIRVYDPIVYNYTAGDAYANFGTTGTYGFEFETRFKHALGMLNFGYSFYRRDGGNVTFYIAPSDNSLHLAFPAHKITTNATFSITKSLSINPTIVFYGQRYGYAPNGAGAMVERRFAEDVIANVYLRYADLFTKGLNVGIGVSNIFDTNRVIIQPYTGGHPPLPGSPREFYLKADYRADL